MSRRHVQLLTRAGCTICDGVHAHLKQLAEELSFDLSATDVDAEAAKGDSALRAEFGDRLPVVLLDGREHSYWEIRERRLKWVFPAPSAVSTCVNAVEVVCRFFATHKLRRFYVLPPPLAFNFLTTFSDMENTQENPTSQNPTPAEEAARQAAEAAAARAGRG